MSFLPIGPTDFLGLYIGLLVAVTIAAGVVRGALRGPSDDPGQLPLDAYQAAFLAGGYRAGADAAMAALAARGSLRADPSGRLAAVEPKPMWLHPVEDAVWTAASLSSSPASALGAGATWLASRLERKAASRAWLTPGQSAAFQRVEGMLRGVGQPVPGAPPETLRMAARPALAQVRDQLRRMGLVMTDAQVGSVRGVPALIVAALAGFGGLRLAFGLAAGHAVGYLIGLLILTIFIALLFLRRPDGARTHRGDRVLRGLRRTNAALRTSAATAVAALAGADLALAVGLFGVGVLSGSPLDDVRRLLQPVASSGGGSDGGSSCGGGSCGGGCGGGCGG